MNGVGPPKVIQRKSRIPKQDSAKPVITSSWVVLGAFLLIWPPARRRSSASLWSAGIAGSWFVRGMRAPCRIVFRYGLVAGDAVAERRRRCR